MCHEHISEGGSLWKSTEMGGKDAQAKKRRVVVVGGSIAGLSCAHSLLRSSEWLEVVVFEKARSVSAAGAGLGLDSRACDALRAWGLGDALEASSLPLSMEEVSLWYPSSPLSTNFLLQLQ